MEICQRCGDVGYDRRTLFMACFAEMGSLGVPFSKIRLHDAECLKDPQVLKLEPFQSEPEVDYKPTDGKLQDYDFYTLRVCKKCRGEWLDAIQKWFNA